MSEAAIAMDREGGRFTIEVDGHVGALYFDLNDAVMAINSVQVPKAIGGRGIAGRLTRTALDRARAEGLTVDPVCPYVQRWLERHPEYQDLASS